MRSFPKQFGRPATLLLAALLVCGAGWVSAAWGELPGWIREVEARSDLEAVFFRWMAIPGGEVAFRRPPGESRPALGELLKKHPEDAALHSLRALEEEQNLEFPAAEADWKSAVEKAADRPEAELSLADFYHRRLEPLKEIEALSAVATAPPIRAEEFTPVAGQRSWRAFERIFAVIRAQGLGGELSRTQYRTWLGRYPQEPSLDARFLDYLISTEEFSAAEELIARYQAKFPGDPIFPVKARALVEYRRGSIAQGLAVYEKAFQPLWAPELIKSYFDLLAQTQNLRKFLDQSRAAERGHPLDLAPAARLFYYYQQQGNLDAARETIARFAKRKDAAGVAWSETELGVCARLLEEVHAYPESARFYFALYSLKGSEEAQEAALAGLTTLLLSAPESPIQFGAGDLSIYREIAKLDPGPGYLNGILSLLLNGTSPEREFAGEQERAVSYFHRSQASQLIDRFDSRFPDSPRRAGLHAALLQYFAAAAESEAVIRGGGEFLARFPKAAERSEVALLMADAYSRTEKPAEEFAIYDRILAELASKAGKIPLGPSAAGSEAEPQAVLPTPDGGEPPEPDQATSEAGTPAPAFQLNSLPAPGAGPRSPEYARLLERYLARLVELKQIPQALGVLRRELDQNPDDPGLYERLALFLDQNRLGAEQAEIYRRAIARFPDRSWYHKLARLYLREKRDSEFEKLTEQAVRIFAGSELERYFQSLVGDPAGLYLRLNLYANQRFPHHPGFVRNLLAAYSRPETHNQAAWEALLRQHWFEEPDLRNRFFEFLTRTGKLESEIGALEGEARSGGPGLDSRVRQNPAAGTYLAEAYLWRSHFEQSAPLLLALSTLYPADTEQGEKAASVFRSLAYFDPAATGTAAKIEERLLGADPGNIQILARLGDTYADRGLFAEASPYWERIARVSPGEPDGYLEAATIYWDYFDFDSALRLLGEGRARFADPTLYSYQAGAIYEAKREESSAVREYVKGALAGSGESPAQARLLALATRPESGPLVDRETREAALAPQARFAAIVLRARVLEAGSRKEELVNFLDSAVESATTLERAAEIETLAEQKSLETVRRHALEKQAALATDPVTRLQLRYALARLYESRKEISAARRNVESLYAENPKIVGVVRSTADFYWRIKLYPQAIAVLERASREAYPELGRQFAFEAARKSTEAGLYPQARELLAPLLKLSPYEGQYLAAMADTYARSGDSQGLKSFYLGQIALLRSAPLSAEEGRARTAELRRGLIPALTRLGETSGAIDQYIELLNAFPEDESLAQEAALYAARFEHPAQLVGYYQKTIVASPRDYRWAMLLARIETSLEQFPAAIEAYGQAIAIRPDRIDLRTARAGLAERLMRLDEALSDYDRVYLLAYKEPKWMEKIAEIRARQGRAAEAVSALRTALLEGGPEKPENFFELARRLESWGLLPEAERAAEQGVRLAGGELLALPEHHAGAKLYARLLVRLRRPESAYAFLQSAYSGAESSWPVLKQQIAREGLGAARDSEWRQRESQIRGENASAGLRLALVEMGSAVARYFTPEEKASFAEFAEKLRGSLGGDERVERFALPLAESAGLSEKESSWRFALLMSEEKPPQALVGDMATYIALERRRLKLSGLGPALERFSARLSGGYERSGLLAAAEAYRSAGDEENELRLLRLADSGLVGGEIQKRYFTLLLSHNPAELVELASSWQPAGQQAADFVLAHGGAALAHQVVNRRGRARSPVWSAAYQALTGLYFAEPSAEIDRSFRTALGDQTIGERLGTPVDRKAQLAGEIWYYYGARYGEYRELTKQGNSGEYLPALLEQSPASAGGYLALADYYAETGDYGRAITDFEHTLELLPGQVEALDRLAGAYFKQGRLPEALASWRLALGELTRQIESGARPESFWGDMARVSDHLRSRHLFESLRPEADKLVRAYLRRNGNYRSNAVLRSVYLAADPDSATSWLLDLASAAPDPTRVLADLAQAPWIGLARRAPLFERILRNKAELFSRAEGFEKENAQQELRTWQVAWVGYLVESGEFRRAAETIASLPPATVRDRAAELVPLELLAAARTGTLDQKIAGYRTDPSQAPSASPLREAARKMTEAGEIASARKLLEFLFAREIENHQLLAANFLGLAEIHIASGDTARALELLRRLVLVVGAPYENLDSAAALLEKSGHPAEAAELLEELLASAPWEPSYRLRLAQAKLAAKASSSPWEALTAIAASREAPYSVRVQAALALSGLKPDRELGSGELRLLAGEPRELSAAAADQPFFIEARVRAAENVRESHGKLLLLERALADSPERNQARLPLFWAAHRLSEDRLALLAIEPVVGKGWLVRAAPALESREESGEPTEEGASLDREQGPVGAGEAPRLIPREQAQIALAVATALVRLGEPGQALAYLETAAKLRPAPSLGKEIRLKLSGVRAALKREQLNLARQPILHEQLEQDRVVRPRLSAPIGAAPDGAASDGAESKTGKTKREGR